jgi:hypothetical protein
MYNLVLVESREPAQNAYAESFLDRLRDESLNQHQPPADCPNCRETVGATAA